MESDTSVLNLSELEIKFKEYAKFVRDVLRPEYQICHDAVVATRTENNEYSELIERITNELVNKEYDKNDNRLMMDVDLGHGKIFCRAEVDTEANRTIFVHVGMGFHVECTWEEAILKIQKRIDYLNQIVLPHKIAKMNKVQSHIQSSENILDQLSREIPRMR